MPKRISAFLGANTPKGFVSLFDELYNPYTTKNAYIIKGGPGSGKSTFMKKVGTALHLKGLDTGWIYCSSDPHSLDALYSEEIGFSIADGTSPHILEPKFPGCGENIINTGAFWDEDILKEKAEDIRSLTLENSLFHRKSASYLAAAGNIDSEIRMIVNPFINEDKINSFAVRFSMRETPKKKNSPPGRKRRMFLSAITPSGKIFLDETVHTLCTRVIGIEDEYSAVSGLLCERIGDYAVKNGYDVIFCNCPLRPKECEHLIIPEAGLCIMTVKSAHETEIACDRLIHSGRFLHEGVKNKRSLLRFDSKLISLLVDESTNKLKEAKRVHDELEKIYVGAMDFGALGRFCDSFTEKLLTKVK